MVTWPSVHNAQVRNSKAAEVALKHQTRISSPSLRRLSHVNPEVAKSHFAPAAGSPAGVFAFMLILVVESARRVLTKKQGFKLQSGQGLKVFCGRLHFKLRHFKLQVLWGCRVCHSQVPATRRLFQALTIVHFGIIYTDMFVVLPCIDDALYMFLPYI